MISLEELEALDLMCWLRNGDDAARLAYCNQSTISRRSQHALKVFKLLPSDGLGSYPLGGSRTLLQMEREVHQLYRLSGGSRLRLHAPYWASRLLRHHLIPGWMVNPPREKEPVAALALLEERVIDAMIAETSQRPSDDNPKFVCFDLYEVPLNLCLDSLAEQQVSKSLSFEKCLGADGVRALSLVKPQGFLSAETKECVIQLFNHLYRDAPGADFGSDQPHETRSPVTVPMAHHPTVFEDCRPGKRDDRNDHFKAKESLVVLRGLEESPGVLALLEILSSSYLDHLKEHPEVVVDKIMAWN